MMPRFVLLRHECPPHGEKLSHWDFMLEMGGLLRTWELRELPTAWVSALAERSSIMLSGMLPGDAAVTAYQLPDHRLAYLDYEGPVDGDRGSVSCCDRGDYDLLRAGDRVLELTLAGNSLQGNIRLLRQGSMWSVEPISGES